MLDTQVPLPNTAIHKRFQGIADEIGKITHKGGNDIVGLGEIVTELEKITHKGDNQSVGLEEIANTILSLAYKSANSTQTDKKGLADIVDKLGSIADAIGGVKVPPSNVVSINISAYILLINLNIFIWWWLCRDPNSRLGCLLEKIQQSMLYTQGIKALSRQPEFQRQFQAVFEPIESSSLRAEFAVEQTLTEEEEEYQKWQKRAAMIQDLCVDILGSFAIESPETSEEFREGQLTEETLAQASPLLHELSQVEAALTLKRVSLNLLKRRLNALQTKLADYENLASAEAARNAFEPLQEDDNTPSGRCQRLLELQKLRPLILQYFASNN